MPVDRVTVDDEAVRRTVRRLFRENPKLRAFPVLALLVSIPLLPALLWIVKHVTVFLWIVTPDPFGLFPFLAFLEAVVVAFAVFVFGFALVVATSNAAVIHNVRRLIDDESVSVLAGLAAAARALPQIVVLALVWAEGGGALKLAERRPFPGRLATLVTRGLGIEVVGSMYFALPAAVVDRKGPIEMFRTSYRRTVSAFDGPTIVSFGSVKGCVLAYGLPVWLLAGVVVPVDAVINGGTSALFEAYPLLVGGIPLALLWLGACTGFALAAAAKTLLYAGIAEDRQTIPMVDRPVAAVLGERPALDEPHRDEQPVATTDEGFPDRAT